MIIRLKAYKAPRSKRIPFAPTSGAHPPAANYFPPPGPFTIATTVALQTMSAVQQAGLVADIEMLSAAMDACSKARDTEGAVHFMDQAIRLGLKPDDTMFREVRAFVCVQLLVVIPGQKKLGVCQPYCTASNLTQCVSNLGP